MFKILKEKYLFIYFFKYFKKYLRQELIVCLLIALSIAVNLTLPLLSRALIDKAILGKNISLLFNIFFIYVVVVIGAEVISNLMEYLQNSVQEKISIDLYKDLFNKLLKMRVLNLRQYQNTEIVNKFFMDAQSIKNLLAEFFITIVTQVIYFVGILTVMITLSPKLTFLSLLPVPLYLIVFKFTTNTLRKMSEDIRVGYNGISSEIDEAYQGASVIKSFAAEKKFLAKFENKIKNMYKILLKSIFVKNLIGSSVNIISTSGSLILWFYGGYLIVKGELTLGTLIALTTYIDQLYGPINVLSSKNFKLQSSIYGLKRVYDFLKIEDEDYSKNLEVLKLNKEITLKNLSFKYPNYEDESSNGEFILKNFSLNIKKGDKILLKGKNGSGKSTFINILLGLYDGFDGEILIDGKNKRDFSIETYRSLFSFVPQMSVLFEGDILSNISLRESNPNLYNYRKFLEKLGLVNSYVGSKSSSRIKKGASNLSGGQIQQISFVRALYKDSDVIIVDEGSSNIDISMKKMFDDIIFKNFSDKTIIVISHDLNDDNGMYKIVNF